MKVIKSAAIKNNGRGCQSIWPKSIEKEQTMGILKRLARLCKADLHGVMDQLEDKCLMLKQYLREMEAGLKHKETRLEQVRRSCCQIQRDMDQRRQEFQKLEQDLELAVRNEKDEIARLLIRRRRTLEGSSEQLQVQMETLTEEKGKIAQTLERQRLQYDQLKIKTAAYCYQAEQRRFEEPLAMADAALARHTPTDEEIELELIQRKEALRQGGAP
jgi:phage shock protein A